MRRYDRFLKGKEVCAIDNPTDKVYVYRPPSKKTAAIVIIIAILTVALCSIFFSLILMFEPDSEPVPEDFYYFSDHTLSVFQNQTGLTFVFDSKTVVRAETASRYLSRDMYGTCAIYYDDADTLYFVNKNGYTKVRENTRDAVLSSDGRYIVLICSDSASAELLIKYDTDKNTYATIEKSAYFSDDANIILSPDGESFVYSKAYGDTGISETYLSVGEAQGKYLDSVQTVLTVSNDGKYILWHDENSNYHRRYKDESINLGKILISTLKSNLNCTEFLYSVQGGGSYILSSGDDPIKISDLILGDMYLPTHALRGKGITVAVNQFTDKLFESSENASPPYNALYLDKNANEQLSDGISILKGKYVSYNVSTIYFVKNGAMIKFSPKHPEDKTTIAKNVISDSLILTHDGKYLYFKDYNSTLYRMSNGVIKSVAKNVETVYLDSSDYLYFSDEDGDIYFIKGASSPKKADISSLDADIAFTQSGGALFILSNGALYSFRGEEVKLLSDDVISFYDENYSAPETPTDIPDGNE